jgi:hypothetical protein
MYGTKCGVVRICLPTFPLRMILPVQVLMKTSELEFISPIIDVTKTVSLCDNKYVQGMNALR